MTKASPGSGGRPHPAPALPGLDSPRLFSLRTVEDTFPDSVVLWSGTGPPAVLAGGGFSGVELAEKPAEMGAGGHDFAAAPQLMNPLDYDMATFLHAICAKNGVTAAAGHRGGRLWEEGRPSQCALVEGGEAIPADLAILAIGVTPENALAKEAGLALGSRGRDCGQPADGDLRAGHLRCGDAVQVKHFWSPGRTPSCPLAGPANKQGRIAADNICGGDSRYLGAQGSSVVKVVS